MEKKKKSKKGIIIALLIIIILAAGGFLAFKMISNGDIKLPTLNEQNEVKEPIVVNLEEEKKEIKIFKGTDRPIAVMIDNHKGAQPQGGLNDAYLVYEIIAEGGESRMMALFKGANVAKIGPVRSSRHYYLDYAFENDAIYVHYGWSPQAEYDIKHLGVNNINGIFEGDKMFWRTKDKAAPHNVATSIEYILKIAEKKGYRLTSTEESLLNYTDKEVILENGEIADKITIPYSEGNKTVYTYDPITKMYTRYNKGNVIKDWTTGEPVTTKNIIITFAKNYPLNDGENKDRQNVNNIGKLKGYYITNGKAIPITCNKTSREAKTIYEDLQGNKIEVNDGRTFINICPIDADVKIEAKAVEE